MFVRQWIRAVSVLFLILHGWCDNLKSHGKPMPSLPQYMVNITMKRCGQIWTILVLLIIIIGFQVLSYSYNKEIGCSTFYLSVLSQNILHNLQHKLFINIVIYSIITHLDIPQLIGNTKVTNEQWDQCNKDGYHIILRQYLRNHKSDKLITYLLSQPVKITRIKF